MAQKIILWSPTNGKQAFDEAHAQNILDLMKGRPLDKVRWFIYDGQDRETKANDLNKSNAIDDKRNKRNSKKRG